MADIRVIKYGPGGHKSEHDPASDSVNFASYKTATNELTDGNLTTLLQGNDASSLHHHDSRYFAQTEFSDTFAASTVSPVKTQSDGYIDEGFIDITALEALLSHDSFSDAAASRIHDEYIFEDGTRDFSGDQSMGGNLLTNVGTGAASITDPLHAANKAYVDAVALGLRPKGDVQAATTVALVAGLATGAEAGDLLDGYTLVVGDRILIKDQVDAKENGIYVVQASGAPVRSLDQDNAPLAEIVNGVFIPSVINGTANIGKAYLITSEGTGTDRLHIIGTDDILFSEFSSPSQLNAGAGIDSVQFASNIIAVELLASGGLEFDVAGAAGKLKVNAADLAGDGIVANGQVLDIDWATDFTIGAGDAKAVRASDLASTSGASYIGTAPIAGLVGDDVQEVLEEILAIAQEGVTISYTAGTGGVTAGDLVYFDTNGTVITYSTLTSDDYVIGIAMSTQLATELVEVVRFDEILSGLTLTGAVAGDIVYWDGSAPTLTRPSGGNSNIWMMGIAQNATTLSVEVRHLFKKV